MISWDLPNGHLSCQKFKFTINRFLCGVRSSLNLVVYYECMPVNACMHYASWILYKYLSNIFFVIVIYLDHLVRSQQSCCYTKCPTLYNYPQLLYNLHNIYKRKYGHNGAWFLLLRHVKLYSKNRNLYNIAWFSLLLCINKWDG